MEEKESRNHTENFLFKNSKAINIQKKIISITGKNYLNPIKARIPADPSSAAFFVALTLLNKKSHLKIKNVLLNQRRIGFYKLLRKSGAKIIFKNIKKINNEAIGDIIVRSSKLRPIHASSKYYASTTDEYPILFVVAALTKGISTFSGVEELANKESNRLLEMQKILKQIGIKSIYSKNQMKIIGKNKNNIQKESFSVKKLGDHRVCMSAMILSLLTGIPAKINNFETVNTSSPSFLKIIKSLGGKFEIKKKS